MNMQPISTASADRGFSLHRGYLAPTEQLSLLAAIDCVVASAPLYVPAMPRTGRKMSVQMTNCGALGWVTCKELGYRYQATHPATKAAWPAIPPCILTIWRELAGAAAAAEPEACLINWYGPGTKLGLHVDQDEQEFTAPVISISLGDDAWFRLGGQNRRDTTSRMLLHSGDVVVLGGAARLWYHGIDRIVPGTSELMQRRARSGGRFNITLRRVTPLPTEPD